MQQVVSFDNEFFIVVDSDIMIVTHNEQCFHVFRVMKNCSVYDTCKCKVTRPRELISFCSLNGMEYKGRRML